MTRAVVSSGGQAKKAKLKPLVAGRAAAAPCILTVLADYRPDAIDLLFVVEGDLYDGESAALPIFRDLLSAFPQLAFDGMVLPASRFTKEFRWGEAPEVLYSRQ